jgi:hypothetical protein
MSQAHINQAVGLHYNQDLTKLQQLHTKLTWVLQDSNLAHHTKLAITRHQQAEASSHHQSNNPKQVQVTSHTNLPVAHSRHSLSVQESVNSQNPLIRSEPNE